MSAADLTQLKTGYGAAAAADSDFTGLSFRDGYFVGPAHWIASEFAHAGTPVYLYRFEYVMEVLTRTRRRSGAWHGGVGSSEGETGASIARSRAALMAHSRDAITRGAEFTARRFGGVTFCDRLRPQFRATNCVSASSRATGLAF